MVVAKNPGRLSFKRLTTQVLDANGLLTYTVSYTYMSRIEILIGITVG